MNKRQLEQVFEIYQEKVMDDEYMLTKGPFVFKVYSSAKTKRIVIECLTGEQLTMHYTIDYQKQEYLPECNGTNVYEKGIALNCEMDTFPPKNYYTLDEELTREFNNHYAVK